MVTLTYEYDQELVLCPTLQNFGSYQHNPSCHNSRFDLTMFFKKKITKNINSEQGIDATKD